MGYRLFSEGDVVEFNDELPFLRRENPGLFAVERTVPVPASAVKYDPLTRCGGVGHPQWVKLKGRSNFVSGRLLRKKKNARKVDSL